MTKLFASLIISSYNQSKTLELLLKSLCRQSEQSFEVILADDGSTDETAQLVTSTHSPFPLYWLTQTHQGYRKACILNQAIRQATADYLIFLDGDTFVGRQYVEDHLFLRKEHGFICGRRVDLSPELTAKVDAKSILKGTWDGFQAQLLWDAFRGETQGWKRVWRVKPRWLRTLVGYDRPLDLLGSNMSLWKKDLEEVNGFNEALQAYWGEDGDLYIRLRNRGKMAINGKNLCLQYHLFHPRRTPHPEHVQAYQRLLKDPERRYQWAEKGLLQSSQDRQGSSSL